MARKKINSLCSIQWTPDWLLNYSFDAVIDFPYHLCPTTTRILETVPLAGRIAGFNRQQPESGIPLHSDGNNMWLTCQMGIKVPEGNLLFFEGMT